SKGSKVTSERVVLVVLSVLLAAALVALCFTIIFSNAKKNNASDECFSQNTVFYFFNRCKKCFNRCCNLFKDDPCYKCEEGWEQHGGKCYYFSISKSSWNESRDECRAKGGDLVKIENVMTEGRDKFWIGLTDSAEEGTWVWVDGSPLDQSLKFWSGKEPDNWKGHNGKHPDGEDCARMGEKGGAKDLNCWFDAFCSKPHRSICEKAGVKGQFKNVCKVSK
uniref:C-type lectin domain-containing protein n=1 Tax=Oreochromis aureus TaxID=47969 RepID=A0AAZ1XHN1_OREAU